MAEKMIKCHACNKEVASSAKTCPSCGAKLKKPIFKKWWFWVLVILFIIIIVPQEESTNSKENDNNNTSQIESRKEVALIDFSTMTFNDIATWCETNKIECYKKEEYSDTIEKGTFVSQSVKDGEKIYEGKQVNIAYSLGKKPSVEYQNALKKAESYSNTMHMSKQGIYNQLVSEYGEKFPADAAQYAIDNMVADWNANALEKAKSYQQTMNMSKSAIYNQLISQYGEKFTQSEAQYAIDHLED